jgi:alpha-L-rhamnosidase
MTPVDIRAHNLGQTACRVVVATSAAAARGGHGDVWDSDKQPLATPFITPANDLPLHGQTTWFWAVRLWDQHDRSSGWSAPESFTTGITPLESWQARWIAATADDPALTDATRGPPAAINTDPPVAPRPLPLFRRAFEITRTVAQAIVCVSGLGQYELRLNGARVGAAVLQPGWTNYRKTILYDTYDVTRGLRPGTNMLGLLLGNGMYAVEKYAGRYTKRVGSFGQPKLILQLRLVYGDGSTDLIVSDASWATRPGPIVLSQAYGGEDFDARLEPRGWDMPSVPTDSGSDQHPPRWQPVVLVDGPGGVLKAQDVAPVTIAKTLTAVSSSQPLAGITVFDLGQNFSGWPRIVVRGPRGRRVKLLPGELLDSQGLVSQRSANARPGDEVSFSYTLSGDGEETWAPRFSYYGFRYVQVEGAVPTAAATPDDTVLISLVGDFLHADLPQVSDFECSSPLLVNTHRLIRQALLSNTMSVLTDCPQREKLGWLEQTYLNADTVFYNQDAITLYEKMLRDMQDAQLADGMVPEIAPEYLAFLNADGTDSIFRDSPEWGAALVLSPWAAYRFSGDRRILIDGYPSMKRYARYLASRLEDGLLDFGLGDWYDIGPQPPGVAQLTSRKLTGTAVYCEILSALERIARTLGFAADAADYGQRAVEATRLFNTKLFNRTTHRYDSGSMTANAMPLAIGLVPQNYRAGVLKNLVADIRAHGNHVTSGDIGFHYVVVALMEYGRGDVLYDILTRTDAPSYGYQLARGATALTEAWDANPTKSQNHFMLGHAESWLYGGLAGIRIDFDRPIESRIRIAPQVVSGVESASARYRSVWGDIVSAWHRRAGRVYLEVEIPAGALARIETPTFQVQVGSGRYSIETREESV